MILQSHSLTGGIVENLMDKLMRIVWHCCLYMIMLGQMLVAVDRAMLSARLKYDWYDHCVVIFLS